MSYQIDIQNALSADAGDKEQEPPPRGIPPEEQLIEWASTALSAVSGPNDAEMTIRLVEEAEIIDLNQTYRHKSGPTNVLSFPAELPDEVELPLLGDVIICAQVISAEAEAQNKALDAHWAHMVVHGTLHLLGYDHIDEAEAEEMETKEIEILADIGYPNPYMVMKKI